ncbi:hypothetical protein C5L22_04880 [Pantoea ananatis]|nr:hypothetical protein C5L22_04880 [Pantoea ananatis]
MIKNIICRFFRIIFKSMIEVYAPPFLILTFAVIFVQIFPEGPLWPIAVFVLIVIMVFPRIFKW